ncbi:putative aarF domain-containing protein kinase 1 [Nowakowskiella sp. JEL0407]|nr:putative aarF domain-containing protein kinase 1 [Nowakowskiella sp. JEL0407]
MLTGRSWDAISNNSAIGGGLATARTNTELATVAKNAQNGHFFKAIVEVLANVPRELLLLFKTNDLLRSVDSALGVGKVGSQVDDMLKIIRVMGWYCAKCIRRETEVEGIWSIAYWRGLFEYLNVGFKLWILGVYLTIKM